MAGISVGSVSVSVVPDMSGFARNLGGQATRIGQDVGRRIVAGINEKLDDITIKVDMGQSMARLATLKRALDKLDGRWVVVQVLAELTLTSNRISAFQQMLDRLDGRSIDIQINVDMSGAVAEVMALNELLDRLDNRTINIDTDRGVAGLARLAGGARGAGGGLGILGKAVSLAKLPALAVGAVAAAAGLVQLAAQLAPVIGLAAAIPAAIGGGIAAILTLKLALHGVGDAFGAALGDDAAKFEKSLKGLSPAAQAAARELRALRPAFLGIKTAAQEAFFGPLKGQITAVTKVLAGPLKTGVRAVAAEFGRSTLEVAKFVRSSAAVTALKASFNSTATSIRAFRPALQPLLTGFAQLATAAAPALVRIAAAAGLVATRFGQWMSTLAESGRIPEILNAAFTVVKQLGTLLANVGGILKSVLDAAAASGGGLFGVLGQVTAQLNLFLKTAAAQQAMTSFFQTINMIGRALAPIIPILGNVVAQLVNALMPVVRALAPAITALVAAFGTIIGSLTPILAPLGQMIAQLVTGLMPILVPIVNLIAQVVAQVGTALVAALIQCLPALQQIVMAVASLLPALAPIIPLIGQLLIALIPIIPPLVQIIALLVGYLAPALRLVITVTVGFLGIVFGLFLPVLKLLVGAVRLLAVVLGPIFTAIGVAVRALGAAAMWLWTNAIGPAFRFIAGVVQAMWARMSPVFAAVKAGLAFIGTAAMWLWHSVIVPVWNGISAAIGFAWGIIRPIFTTIVTVIRTVLGIAFTVLLNIVKTAWAAIQIAIGIAWAIIRPIFTTIATVIRTVLSIAFTVFRNLVKAVWIAIQIQIKVAWALIKPIFNAIVNVVKNVLGVAFTVFKNLVKTVWIAIQIAIKLAWAIIRPIFNAIKAVIDTVVIPIFRLLWEKVIKPLWDKIKNHIVGVYNDHIRPVFDRLKEALGKVKDAFKTAVEGIKSHWDKIQNIAKKPVNFVIGIYNAGIVNLVNKIADFADVKTRLKPIDKLARGGVLPGYAPGKDRLIAAVSPGEAVMRPEWTRAVGPSWVHAANAVARTRGVGGVQQWMGGGFARGGIIGQPPQFAGQFFLGGIVGDFIKGVKDFTIGNIVKAAGGLLNKLFGVVPGSGVFRDVIAGIPNWIKTTILGWLKVVAPKLGGDASGVVAAAKSMIGQGDDGGDNNNWITRKWGMVGAPWCSMFVSEAISKAKAQKKYPGHPSAAVASYVGAMKHVGLGDGRAGDLAAYRGSGHINVIEAKSGSGYMTIGGNQNALVQRGVRGGQSSILRPGFGLGGIVANQAAQIFRHEAPRNADKHEMQTPLVQLMRSLTPGTVRPVAQAIARNRLTVTDASAYDAGGYLPTGPSLVYNGTGRPEPVLTGDQFSALANSGRKVSVMEGATVIVQDPVDIDMLAQRQEFAARSATFG